MTDDLGRALGPLFVAALITKLGRQTAFNISICGSYPAAALLLALWFCLQKDEVRVGGWQPAVYGHDWLSAWARVLLGGLGRVLSLTYTLRSSGGEGGFARGRCLPGQPPFPPAAH